MKLAFRSACQLKVTDDRSLRGQCGDLEEVGPRDLSFSAEQSILGVGLGWGVCEGLVA